MRRRVKPSGKHRSRWTPRGTPVVCAPRGIAFGRKRRQSPQRAGCRRSSVPLRRRVRPGAPSRARPVTGRRGVGVRLHRGFGASVGVGSATACDGGPSAHACAGLHARSASARGACVTTPTRTEAACGAFRMVTPSQAERHDEREHGQGDPRRSERDGAAARSVTADGKCGDHRRDDGRAADDQFPHQDEQEPRAGRVASAAGDERDDDDLGELEKSDPRQPVDQCSVGHARLPAANGPHRAEYRDLPIQTRCFHCGVIVAGPALPLGAPHIANVGDCRRCRESERAFECRTGCAL